MTRSGDLSTFLVISVNNTPSNPTFLILMPFTDIYASILLPFVERYKVAENQKSRALVIKKAAEAVMKSRHLLEDTGIDLPKDLNTVCGLPSSV
jgi:hypothetical protein